jgi:iron complex outermembrane receptor protein
VLVNAGAGAGLTNKKGKILFNLYIMGNNLLNAAYQDHLSRLKYFEPYPDAPNAHHGIYNIGTNIAIKLDVPLDFNFGD